MPETFDNDVKTMVFTELGAVELLDASGTQIWASDDDDDFADEFADEFLSEADADDVADYLMDRDLLDDGEEFDVREVTLAEATGEHEALTKDDDDDDDS